jgi:cytochrome bd-type quinol oxidase subunit 2
MDKKTIKILGIVAAVVVVIVVGYLIYMYGIMPAGEM